MIHPWPAVTLGEVLKHRKEFISIDDSQEYKRCRIKLHAKLSGILLKERGLRQNSNRFADQENFWLPKSTPKLAVSV